MQLSSPPPTVIVTALALLSSTCHAAPAAEVRVDVSRILHAASRLLTGACIEDVNHEIYGGLWTQLIFGESFQEPSPGAPPVHFKSFGGEWSVREEALRGGPGDGPKLLSEAPPFSDGRVGVEVRFEDRQGGNAGLIVRVANAGPGADNFDGYEVSLYPSSGTLRLGRHVHNWELLGDVPCEVPLDRWIRLEVTLAGKWIEASVDGKLLLRHEDTTRPLLEGSVGLRQWQRPAAYRGLWVETAGRRQELAFQAPAVPPGEVSGMWKPSRGGNAEGSFALFTEGAFIGRQSQRLTFVRGEGHVGIENQGLNRWGIAVKEARTYEGLLQARASVETELWLTLESADGSRTLAEARVTVPPGGWRRLPFELASRSGESRGRFSIQLRKPGSVDLGYVLLEPGPWGKLKGLPVRRDVAEGLIDQGITVLRYGGSMVNHTAYRWKNMIGPRDLRPPTPGTWYPHSSNGWGILDFLDFCEAAGFEAIPAFHFLETPEDLADFAEYALGGPETPWGARRVANGRVAPYSLRYLELGNEERVDEKYAERFEVLAEAIWKKAPDLILIVGDFVYSHPIRDPDHVTGAASGITNLKGQERILKFCKARGKEVWFDLHVGTDGPRPDSTFSSLFTFIDALERLADGAKHRVVVFEFNSGNHSHRRALANALAIQAIERDGRVPIACSANCLQPDGQNDNGWDQGLLFLDPDQVWLQPPGWVTRMAARAYERRQVEASVTGSMDLDVSARCSEDGKALTLGLVHPGEEPLEVTLRIDGFKPSSSTARLETLEGPLEAVNTARHRDAIVPRAGTLRHELRDRNSTTFTLPPRSYTTLRFE